MSAPAQRLAEAPAAARGHHPALQHGALAALHSAEDERPATSIRAVSARQTLQTIQPWLPHFGIRRVIDISLAGVPACPVFQVLRDDARSAYFNAGKGYAETESRVSGLMEAIEVHCYERASPALLVAADGLAAADAARVLTPQQLQADGASDPGPGPALLVRGHSHLDGQPAWLPAHLVWRELGDGRLTAASPNGVASGNAVDEALVHALCEMLERHGLAAFHQGRPLASEWVLPPHGLAPMQRCLSQLRALGMEAHFLLISMAASVPVFICFLTTRDGQGRALAVQGYGAHLDPAIAMARALAEAVQILALCPVQDGAGPLAAPDERSVVVTSKQAALLDAAQITRSRQADFLRLARLRQLGRPVALDYLFDPDGPASRPAPAEALARLLDGLAAEGVQRVLHCVISPPGLPVVVVKCFCPGLACVAGL